MSNYKLLAAGCAVLLLTLAIGGCSSDDKKEKSKDSTSPTVTSVHPADDATGVSLGTIITANFSEAMNASTITGGSFLVAAPGPTPVAGAVSYNATTRVATFQPSSQLTANTLYTATITTGVEDLAGNSLATDYQWSFTTGTTGDTTPPTVSSTNPAHTATDVPLNQSITAFFSEALDPATVTTTSFTLMDGTNAVAGNVSSPGMTAVFTPQNNLDPSTVYTATLTTDIADPAGNALAADYVWTFTTGTTADTTAPTVSSTNPAHTATGVPVNQAIAAYFSESLDPTTVTTASFTLMAGANSVAGSVTTPGTTAVFTPLNNLAPSTMYTATLTTDIEDSAGNALVANYVWSFTTGAASDTTAPSVTGTDPAHTATDVSINQAIAAYFSEALDPATITTATFTLMDGTSAVPGTLSSSGMTAVFRPLNDLASSTMFTATLTTGIRDLAGNALPANYVWTFTTGTTTDTTAPTVNSTNSVHTTTGFPINQAITAFFSESLDPATITAASFTLMDGANAVAGAVTSPRMAAVFTPLNDLTPSTMYTATLTTDITDLAGNALAANFSWTFTTSAAADTTPPTVSSTTPAHSATDVPVNQAITAFFSESLDPATVTTTTFTLMDGTNAVAGSVTSPGMTAVFTPLNELAPFTLFTATLTTGIKDLAGNALVANYVWSFTTGATPDTTPPTVTSTTPADTATDVPVNQTITAFFSEALDPVTVTTSTFTLMDGTNAVAGSVTNPGMTAVFTPLSDLAPFTLFTATLTTGIKDLAGNAMVANYVWSFTTGAAPDITPPVVTSTDPDNMDSDVPVNYTITAVFSEPLNPATVTTATFILMDGTNAVAGSVTSPGTSAVFKPLGDLTAFTTYTARLTTDIRDLAGNAMVADYVWSFQTGNVPAIGPAPVGLGTAGNFVALAKSAVSVTGTTSIVGDLGLSPAAGSFFTGFSETMDASNEFSTSPIVTGRLYAADYAPPTPTMLTTAVSDMQIAYTDAANRTNPDHTELGAGNINGMTLTPGLYKWGTGVEFANGVTLSGGANDVWIFQIAQDLTVGSGAMVTLTGGAQAKNIFWQVAGQTTLGTTADFKGIVLCQTAIVLDTGAVLNGRALAQTAVTLDANTVTEP